MAMYIKNNCFVLDTFNQIINTPVEEKESVIVLIDSFKKKPILNQFYSIKDDLFVEDEYGDWKCISIHWRESINKKWWQFWENSKIATQILMLKIK